MKKQWIIVIIILGGTGYFLADLWLNNPFSVSKKTSQIIVEENISSSQSAIDDTFIELADDKDLEKEFKQLSSTYRDAIRDSDTSISAKPYSKAEELNKQKGNISPSPWSVADLSVVGNNVRLRDDVEPVQLIQLDINTLKSLQEGDQFDFPAFNEHEYTVMVSKAKTLWNGDTSISGTILSGDGTTFPVVISSGKNATFASFSTSEGSYELESFGKFGALYSVTEMDNQAFYPETDELF